MLDVDLELWRVLLINNVQVTHTATMELVNVSVYICLFPFKYISKHVVCSFVYIASCQSDAECGLSEQCLQGQCNNPCERQGACGLNSNCKVFNHVKHCSCPPGFTGGSEIECVRSM